MRRTRFITGVIAVFLLTLTAAEAGMKLKPGTWEMSIKMTGLPVQMPAIKNQYCITNEKPVPMDKRQKKDCKFKWSTKKNSLFWSMNCKNGIKGEAKFNYKWDRMIGYQVISSRGQTIKSTFKGRWVAPGCKKRRTNR